MQGDVQILEFGFVLTVNRGHYTPLVIPAQAGIQCANEIVNIFAKTRENTVLPAFFELLSKCRQVSLRVPLDSRFRGLPKTRNMFLFLN